MLNQPGKRGGKRSAMNTFLVFLEQREGVVKESSIDTWNLVQELAALHPDTSVSALLAGSADIRQLDTQLAGTGIIYQASEEAFRLCNPQHYTTLIAETMKMTGATSLFFADTALSRDLAPRLSVRLKASLLSGCPTFDNTWPDGGGCQRPVYSGAAMASFAPCRPLKIYTITPRANRSSATKTSGSKITFELLDPFSCSSEELFPLVRRMTMHKGVADVAEAAIIVAGGRGMGGAEGFVLLEELARLLGGAVGASRPVVDEGWRHHAEQIGQTGKTVAPALYLACAISGAPQHLAAIGSAGTIVGINRDPHAPIFDVADYGIVGDVHTVLPKLIEELQEFLKKK
jgi:electron transfer flavoprotein alpha subunit